MALLNIEHSGRPYCLSALTFQADLDIGWSGTAVLQEPLQGVQRGSIAKLSVANRTFDIVVQEFHTPWKEQGRQCLTFTDPVQATRRFDSEVFSESQGHVSDERVVQSRIKCQGPESFTALRWPHVVIDGLSTVEVLRAICAREVNWHFLWINDRVILGPLPDTDPIELPSSNEADVDGGFEADYDLAIPMLGDRT
ncbi:MAG: hypothetical protein JWM11_5316, partial [Planctomycetaceae bacterium]|nr:hypothetical protein [Planctomycetaceae bacterium]